MLKKVRKESSNLSIYFKTVFLIINDILRQYTFFQGGKWLDLKTIYPQWIIHFLLHGAHLLLIFLLPVPGCPK
jgi:hypothetical protein